MKKTYIHIIAFIISILSFTSCEVANQLVADYESSETSNLRESEVIQGLKRALNIGADMAVSDLSKPDAFYSNAAYKILLPKEAQFITDNKNNPLLQAVGVDKMINDVEISMNKAAEKAVNQAKPIFVNAITNMSIQDAFGILNGSDTAASNYLRRSTYQQLYAQFKPEISKTLNQPIYKGVSTNYAWSNLTSAYNGVANFVPSWNHIDTNLDNYVTNKALQALFEEIKNEEKKIRKDPAARVEDILKKVFK